MIQLPRILPLSLSSWFIHPFSVYEVWIFLFSIFRSDIPDYKWSEFSAGVFGVLNENIPHRLWHLSTWFSTGGTGWRSPEIMKLWCCWRKYIAGEGGLALRFQSLMLFLPWAYGSRCKPNASCFCCHASLPLGFYSSRTISSNELFLLLCFFGHGILPQQLKSNQCKTFLSTSWHSWCFYCFDKIPITKGTWGWMGLLYLLCLESKSVIIQTSQHRH